MMEQYKLYKHAWIYNDAPDEETALSEEQIRHLLRKGGWMVRNTYDFDRSGQTDFWYVIKDSFGGLEELGTKTRNQVRRGLSRYSVRRITEKEILEKGYSIYCEAAASYKVTAKKPDIKEFQDRITKAGKEIEYWGAFNTDDEPVAFSINRIGNGYCDYQTMKALPADKKNYVYYALIYEMNRHYLQDRQLKYVLDGARSITEHSNIQPFLMEKFNFRKAYCHLRIQYKWWFGLTVRCLYPFSRVIRMPQIQAVLAMHRMQS